MDDFYRDPTANPGPIPLTVLTGFLGAGKTTLLNRILSGSHGLKVAVLVNDFGAINIDAQLVVGIESNVVSLTNGCICCSIRDDLIAAVMQTINRPERPDYILLEASGVAEPSGIALTFNNSSLFRDRIRLDGILCVVDAEQVFAAPEAMELKIFQMACADLIILNKVDLVDRERVLGIRGWLNSRFHRYRLIEASHCDAPLEILLSVGGFDPARLAAQASTINQRMHAVGSSANQHQHDDRSMAFGTWSYETDRPLALGLLRAVMAGLPAEIYRAKGVIYTSDVPKRRTILQVVGRRVDVTVEEKWGDQSPRTRIVLIGAPGAVEDQKLRDSFDACLAAGQPRHGTASALVEM